MGMVKRILALFLVATAAAVALNLILTPVYHNGSPDYPVWRVLNWFMAASVLVALVVSFMQRRALGGGEATSLASLRAGVICCAAIVLTMLFFWEWFWTLNPESETGDAVTSHIIYFPIVDSLLVVVTLVTGVDLWKDAGDSQA